MLLCHGLTFMDDYGKTYSLGVIDSLAGNTTLDLVAIVDTNTSDGVAKIVGCFPGAKNFTDPNDRFQMDSLDRHCRAAIQEYTEQVRSNCLNIGRSTSNGMRNR